MATVGIFDAKTHLTELIGRVEQGEEIVITRRGEPVAKLVPHETDSSDSVAEVVARMLRERDERGPKLGKDLTIRSLIEEGRRY
jgi:prevent-host-death family protein